MLGQTANFFEPTVVGGTLPALGPRVYRDEVFWGPWRLLFSRAAFAGPRALELAKRLRRSGWGAFDLGRNDIEEQKELIAGPGVRAVCFL